MKSHNLILHENSVVTPCPKCRNNTEFNALANHCCDEPHLVYEIHVECNCGYDPTALLVEGYRHQNEPGEPEEASIEHALSIWNTAIVDVGLAEIRKARAANLKSTSIPSPETMIVEREQDLLAKALQDWQKDGKQYLYSEAVSELFRMAKDDPESFRRDLPELRLISEKRESFDEELVTK